ncbi:MAG: pyrroline-5-carboxylate reductase [Oscillospiraceae bacterium]|nr:pyrroline-5-carboxylate reductase [Oscillospiraceae bacterium]
MKFGMIGCGNMGGAVAAAVAQAAGGAHVLASDHHEENLFRLRENYGTRTGTALEAAACEYVFLGVKPQAMETLFAEIGPTLRQRRDRFVLVSMAAGLTIAGVRTLAGIDCPVIRIMPNLPVAEGAGMTLYAANGVTAAEQAEFLAAMAGTGLLDELPERLIDAASAVAGCGPAYACLFLEALADGGVACGLPRAKARLYAAQMLLGTAQMALDGESPAARKDAVCSPGGTTIAGVRALERAGFRAAAMDAVQAAYERTLALKK